MYDKDEVRDGKMSSKKVGLVVETAFYSEVNLDFDGKIIQHQT